MRHHADQLPVEPTARIQFLNDAYRSCVPYLSDFFVNSNVIEAMGDRQSDLWRAIRDFDKFTDENDPYYEHDFGSVNVNGHEIWWKINYYDENREYGSSDPSNPAITHRVMTVYFPEDH